jgi:integrase
MRPAGVPSTGPPFDGGPPSRPGAPHGSGFHELRHYYASLLIMHGESVKVVQARLGHASASETLDTSSHFGRTATTARVRLSIRYFCGLCADWGGGQ